MNSIDRGGWGKFKALSVYKERADILKKLASSSRRLAELKGVAASIPNQDILINTLGLQEAKEVLRYRRALRVGYERVRSRGLLTVNHRGVSRLTATKYLDALVGEDS